MNKPLYPEDGRFHITAKAAVKAAYRVAWNASWSGARNEPKSGPVLLVSNHPSYLEPLLVYVGLRRRIFWMAWKKLFNVSFMGDFISRNGAFPVSNLVVDVHAIRTAARLLKDGFTVGVYPEGGRSLPDGEMLPFIAGPFRLAVRFKCPVLPVTVNGSWKAWSRSMRFPAAGGRIRVHYHPPILPPHGEGCASAEEAAAALASRSRRVILSRYEAPDDVLRRSRVIDVLDPDDHPIFKADREDVPLMDWLRKPENARWRDIVADREGRRR